MLTIDSKIYIWRCQQLLASMQSKISQENVSKVTAGKILGWFFGVLFIFTGVIFAIIGKMEVLFPLLYITIGVIILPLTNPFLKKRFNFELSGGAKVLIIIGVFVLFTMVGIKSASKEGSTTTSVDSAQAFFTILDQVQDDTRAKLGEPNAQIFLDRKVTGDGIIHITLGKDAYYDDNSLKDMGHLLMTAWARIDQGKGGLLMIYFYNQYGREIMEATYSSFAGVQVKLL